MKKKSKLQKLISFIEKGYNWLWVSLAVIVICFILIPLLVVNLNTGFIYRGFIYDNNTADIANTIGGIASPLVALVAVVLTFIAFYIQFQANEQQNLNFKIQQFESSFFELLRLHGEILETVEINGKKGKLAFKEPNIAVRTAYDAILKAIKDIEQRYSHRSKELKAFCRAERDDYAFKLVYYGQQSSEFYNGLYRLNRDFYEEEYEHADLVNNIISLYVKALKTRLSGENLEIPAEYEHGIGAVLDPYFSHLYHTIDFIHTRKFLKRKQKKFYVKTIVNQLSPDEQVTLFYLSISTLGENWRELIKKYSLIKNVPFIPDFKRRSHPNWWYPKIKYTNPPSYILEPAQNFNNGDEDAWPDINFH